MAGNAAIPSRVRWDDHRLQEFRIRLALVLISDVLIHTIIFGLSILLSTTAWSCDIGHSGRDPKFRFSAGAHFAPHHQFAPYQPGAFPHSR